MTAAHLRLWRARRRHVHIDAMLRQCADGWEVSYSRDDRPLMSRRFETEDDARADAVARFRELQRAGWIDHW
jgi:hypothetical protein